MCSVDELGGPTQHRGGSKPERLRRQAEFAHFAPNFQQSELSLDDMRRGVPALLAKIAKYRPRIVCFLSKTIWEVFRQETHQMVLTQHADRFPTPEDTPGPLPASPRKPLRSRFFLQRKSADPSEDLDTQDTPPSQSPTRPRRHTFEWGAQPFRIVHDSPGTLPPT